MTPSLAICVIVRDEARYIEEWLAFHLLQGASRILVYDNGSSDNTAQLVARFGRSAPITLIDWAARTGHFDTVQRDAYRDGIARLKGVSDFVAFIDSDEFLHAGSDTTAVEALTSFGPDVSAIAVNQRVFGSSGKIGYDPAPVTARFIRCTDRDYDENCWFKTIARPQQTVDFDSVHSVVVASGSYAMNDGTVLKRSSPHPGKADEVAHGALTLNHYMLRSLEEFREKQSRWKSRPDMASRYDMGYFTGRDAHANATSDDRLVMFSESVAYEVERLRRPAEPATQASTSSVVKLMRGEALSPTAPIAPPPMRETQSLLGRAFSWINRRFLARH